MRPCVRGCPTFRFYMRCARGKCIHARADARHLGFIRTSHGVLRDLSNLRTSRAGKAPLRARGMPPCVRGRPVFSSSTHCARGKMRPCLNDGGGMVRMCEILRPTLTFVKRSDRGKFALYRALKSSPPYIPWIDRVRFPL